MTYLGKPVLGVGYRFALNAPEPNLTVFETTLPAGRHVPERRSIVLLRPEGQKWLTGEGHDLYSRGRKVILRQTLHDRETTGAYRVKHCRLNKLVLEEI